MVSYHSNMEKGLDYWKPPKNSAVQLAAAITVSASIYMYKYISREDCYYTLTPLFLTILFPRKRSHSLY